MRMITLALAGCLAIILLSAPAGGEAASGETGTATDGDTGTVVVTAPGTAEEAAAKAPDENLRLYFPMLRNAHRYDTNFRIYIPRGEFEMGCDPDHNGGFPCNEDELPLHTVYLDAYYIDTKEVTNALYARCVADGVCSLPYFNSSYTREAYYDNPDYANYPVIHVDWYAAVTFCRWAGGSLPSEAQWEKAARGSTDRRAFPWGEAPADCTLANYAACVGDTSAVGSYPAGASAYGALDMGGNVWEWVYDWYSSTTYTDSAVSNPVGPESGTERVLRGGGWYYIDSLLRVASRHASQPGGESLSIGFRCVVPPD